MTDWAMSGRRDEYTYHLVDPFTLVETGEELETEEGGTITWGYYTDNLYSASLPLVGSVSRNFMVRVKHLITLPTGESCEETLGTFFVTNDEGTAEHGLVTRSLDGYSTLIRFTEEILSQDFSRKKGYVVTDEVEELVTANGGLIRFGAGVDMEQQHTQSICFEIGTLQSEVLNTIAGWTGCELGVDADGYVTWSVYTKPSKKAVSYEFDEGDGCAFVAGYTWSDENDDKVNRVVARYSRDSKDDDDDLPLADSVVVDLPSTYAYSYENIGRRVTYDMELSDPCTEAELTEQAEDYLYENCSTSQYYEITHPSVPGLSVGDVVTYSNDSDGSSAVSAKCLVTEIEMELGPGAMCTTKLKVI